MENRKPELLSPAGKWESLVAAVQNGADAIYLGEKSFSARKNASKAERQTYTATCAACGGEAVIPFRPREDRPVYCSECFAEMKIVLNVSIEVEG